MQANSRVPAAGLQVRLSERNVVELIGKLQGAGLLGPDLLHTLNGREYLTQDQLRTEVQAAVESAGGRVPVVGRGFKLI
jgi:E3 UFM1-protein ligase 1